MKPIILFFKKPKKVSSRPARKMVLFFKAEVKGHKRRLASGKIVTVRPYWNKRGKKPDEGVEPWKRVKDLAQTSAMPKIHPDVLRSGDAAQIQAAEALVKALTVPEWPENRLKPNSKMTQTTLKALHACSAVPEVKDYLTELAIKGYRVDSRQWHYFRYKYLFYDDLSDPSELDRRFTAVLQDSTAQIYKPGARYIVYSPKEDRLSILEPDGRRVSVYRPLPNELETFGEKTWIITNLLI